MNKAQLKIAGCLVLIAITLLVAISTTEVLYSKLFSAITVIASAITYKLITTQN